MANSWSQLFTNNSRNPYENIFGGNSFDYNYTPQEEEETQVQKYLRAIRERYARKGPMTQQYERELTNVPTREANKPSWINKIGAVAAGFGAGMKDPARGVALTRDIWNNRYNQAMEDYSTKVGVSQKGAELERRSADDETDALARAYGAGIGYDKFNRTAGQGDTRLNIAAGESTRKALYGNNLLDWRNRSLTQTGDIANTNAGIAGRRADIAGFTANTGRAAQEETARNNRVNNALGRTNAESNRQRTMGYLQSVINATRLKPVPPKQLDDATAYVIKMMYNEETFRDEYIKIKDGIYELVPLDEDDPYSVAFHNELADRVKKVLDTKR